MVTVTGQNFATDARLSCMFGDKAKAIQVCVNRFDEETKTAFLELYDKVDADFVMPTEGEHVTYGACNLRP